jgi:peptidoglycan/LPS O-acetylase OafA/YrhL
MSTNHNQGHRTDIDGLRALAILPVLIYHAKLGCPGGYVGVDIFFVISGYLITSLILKEQAEGVFNLPSFWERRIRRIFPAMALMLAGTFLIGWFMFLPDDFQLMAKSAIAQTLLVSNVFFYQQTLGDQGYFGPAADTKLLLHTWSLSVEEQFYLLFPALMILVTRRRMALCAIAVVGLLSLAMSFWYLTPQYFDPLTSFQRPGVFLRFVFGYWHRIALLGGPSPAGFFLLPPRAWELLLGSLLAFARGKLVPDTGAREVLGWLGVGMVGFAIFCYNEKTPFPGLGAILPCLGAALIIFSSEGKLSLVGRLLSLKLFVFIGLISYSLYLWHWPLLVFEKYPVITAGPWQRAAALAVSFALATLSWKFVEMPFRTRRLFPKRSFLFTFAGSVTALLLALSYWVYSRGGIPARLSAEANRYAGFRSHFVFRVEISSDQAWDGQVPQLGITNNRPFDLVVWGDSHAQAMAPVIDDLCRKYSVHGALTADPSVPPLLFANDGKNEGLSSAVVHLINQQHIKIVIIVVRWTRYDLTPQFKKGLIFAVQTVLRSGARVYILKDVPHPGFDVPRLVASQAMHGVDLSWLGTSPSEYSDLNKPMDETFKQLTKMGATVLDPTPYFINSRGLYGVIKDDQILYTDDDHISVEGAALLTPLFEPIFQTNTALISSHQGGNNCEADGHGFIGGQYDGYAKVINRRF